MTDVLQFLRSLQHISNFIVATEEPLNAATLAMMQNAVKFFNLNRTNNVQHAFLRELQKFETNLNAYMTIYPLPVVVSMLSTKPLYCLRGLCLYLNNFRIPKLSFLMDIWDHFTINGFFGFTSSHLGSMMLHVIPLMVNVAFQIPNQNIFFGVPPPFPIPNPSPLVLTLSRVLNFPRNATMQQIIYFIHCCIQVSTRNTVNVGYNGWTALRNPLLDSPTLRIFLRNIPF